MSEQIESLSVLAQTAADIKDMFQNSRGWVAVRDTIDEMRREAFTEWGNLKLDAKTEDIIAVRAKEKVLKELLERLEEAVKKGDEARDSIAAAEAYERGEARFRTAQMTSTDEIEALRKSLSAPSIWTRFSEAITRR